MFMLLEDEPGVVNVIVPPPVYESSASRCGPRRSRSSSGKLERREGVTNVVACIGPAARDARPRRGRGPADRAPSRARARPGRASGELAAVAPRAHSFGRRADLQRLSRDHARNLAEHMFCPSPFLACAHVNLRNQQSIAQRLLGAVDLAIDFATLGEYGLEPLPADGPCRERTGHPRREPSCAAVAAPCMTPWEALTAARPRGCDAGAARAIAPASASSSSRPRPGRRPRSAHGRSRAHGRTSRRRHSRRRRSAGGSSGSCRHPAR